MNRWSTFFFFFIFLAALPSVCQGLPGLCNLLVSTSFCKADSIKITPVAVEKVTGVRLILPIGFYSLCFFSLGYCFACHLYCVEDKLSVT